MTDLAKLREPFPASVVGKLPRVTCKACSNADAKHCDKHAKKDCVGCGNWITTAHIHLDYVGHAEVTDRLLSVDPAWTWEPLAYADDGTPLVKKGVSGEWELWIKLTVLGVTRIGVGSVSTGFDAEKQLVGDALRNAAMRFGVALDLWSKAELESSLDDTPLPEADPAKVRRAKLFARVKALPEHSRTAFKGWLADNGYPDLPSKLNDDQCAAAEEWVTFAESAAEHEAAPAPDPPREAAVSHDTPTEGVTAPDAAMDGRTAAAAHYVKGLDSAQLLAEFARRNLRAPRPVGEQRVALTAALVADESWNPDE